MSEAHAPMPFVVGVPRSGTTLLRFMLDAHPQLALPPETHFIPMLEQACSRSPQPRRAFMQALTTHVLFRDWQVDTDALAGEIRGMPAFSLGGALRAFYRQYAARHGKARWGDKTPDYIQCMGLIQGALPEAHFIHIIRDGRDVALSVRDKHFGPNTVDDAAAWWVKGIEGARRQSAALKHYLELRYEDLVADPEAHLRRICDLIGLPYEPAMLRYHESAAARLQSELGDVRLNKPTGVLDLKAAERHRIHEGTGRPPEASRIGQWRGKMTPDQRRRFEQVAGKLLASLGYEAGSE